MRTDPLPQTWHCLEGIVRCVRRESDTTYTCSCPHCGGDWHQTGEPSDRCALFDDEHPTLYCRRCGFVAYPDQFGDKTWSRPSSGQLEAWRKQREKHEEARKRSAEHALANLRKEELWLKYHENLGEAARRYWQNRGVPPFLQDWWKLGWRLGQYPTATIPLFGPGWAALNVKHRYIETPPNRGRYFYELRGQGQPMFLCNPDLELSGNLIIVEGEIKSMVTYATLSDETQQTLGLPGLNLNAENLALVRACERLTLIVDPDARQQAWKLVRALGREKCRVLIPPMKIDDGILAGGLGKRDLELLIRNAIPA